LLDENQNVLSPRVWMNINDILGAIVDKQQYCLSHNYNSTISFGFVGDSLVESANAALKGGIIRVDGTQGLDTSAMRQIQIISNQATNQQM